MSISIVISDPGTRKIYRGTDNTLHQLMAHHVIGIEKVKLIPSASARISAAWRSRSSARGRSTWVTSPLITAVGTESDSRQEHLHLFRGGILGFIQIMQESFNVRPACRPAGQPRSMFRSIILQPAQIPAFRTAHRTAGADKDRFLGQVARQKARRSPASTAGRTRTMRRT